MASEKILPPADGDFEENSDRTDVDILEDFKFTSSAKKEHSLSPKPKEEGYDDTDNQSAKPEAANLLDPNHPLLARFQKSLKEYLFKQIQHYKDDILELDELTKKTISDHEKLGAESYEVQQIVAKQQTNIDNCVKELETLSAAKSELDIEMVELNEVRRKVENKLLEAEKHEVEIRTETDAVVTLLNKMKKWEHDVQSELLINQRISEKTRNDKTQLAIEKKQQDVILYKLMAQVWKLEGKLETIVLQLRVMEEQREKLAEAAALTNTEVEANETDQKCLLKGWQSILVSIASRETHYNNLLAVAKEMECQMHTLGCEGNKIKQFINTQLLQNQSLTVFNETSKANNKHLGHQINLELEKKHKFDALMRQSDAVLARLQEDLQRIGIENHSVYAHLNVKEKEYAAVNKTKLNLDEDILKVVQDKLIKNRVTDILRIDLGRERELARELRISLVRKENINSKALRETNFQVMENKEIIRLLDQLRNDISIEDAELLNSYKEYDACDLELCNQRRQLEVLATKQKAYDLEAETGGTCPLLQKIRIMELKITQIQDKIKLMESFWLREQGIVIEMSEKRQGQIKDINVLKKQITILDQKNIKITAEIEQFRKQEEITNRSIDCLTSKLVTCTNTLNKKKLNKDELDVMNAKFQCDITTKLEESEFDSLKIKSELSEIIEDKALLSNALVEKNREFLCWEAKILLAVKARKDIMMEYSEDGGISKMKTEIHRMNVRYSQLRRAQEKLIVDLEHCISRREGIFIGAEARSKYKGGINQLRVNFSRKLDDLRNKIKKAENDLGEYVNASKGICEEIARIKKEVNIKQMTVQSLIIEQKKLGRELDLQYIDKQMKLDIMLFKQRKLKVYAELSKGRSPFLVYKTSNEINNAYNKESEINRKLRILMENLLESYPEDNVRLTKMHNTLSIPALML